MVVSLKTYTKKYNVSLNTAYNRIKRKEIEAKKVGGNWFVCLPDSEQLENLISVQEAADYLGCSTDLVYQLMKKKNLSIDGKKILYMDQLDQLRE